VSFLPPIADSVVLLAHALCKGKLFGETMAIYPQNILLDLPEGLGYFSGIAAGKIEMQAFINGGADRHNCTDYAACLGIRADPLRKFDKNATEEKPTTRMTA
jgi:hypothetical protein